MGHWFTGTQEEGGEKEGTADKKRPKKTGVLGKSTATHSGRRIAASLLTTHTHTQQAYYLPLEFTFSFFLKFFRRFYFILFYFCISIFFSFIFSRFIPALFIFFFYRLYFSHIKKEKNSFGFVISLIIILSPSSLPFLFHSRSVGRTCHGWGICFMYHVSRYTHTRLNKPVFFSFNFSFPSLSSCALHHEHDKHPA